jgi:ABC-type uncharacterized transport system substrate-binding protein
MTRHQARAARRGWGMLAAALFCAWWSGAAAAEERMRLAVVDSYHAEYGLSRDAHEGFCAAMLGFGYFDTKEQAQMLERDDAVETSRVVVKKFWMNTKRKNSREEILKTAARIGEAVRAFHPDLLFLAEDNAANYIGNQFLDTEVPVVFWGVNNTPVKYGLVDSMERPGHNVTGIYQVGYYAESLRLLKQLVPAAKTFAVLSDASETGRAHVKAIEQLMRQGALPMELVDMVTTNEWREWQSEALRLQALVDVFYIAQYNALKDEQGVYVIGEDVVRWHLEHVRLPEATGFESFVRQGLLCAVDDSLYKQAFEAVAMAHDRLENRVSPTAYPPRAPARGPTIVNMQRARVLGISLPTGFQVDHLVDEAGVLNTSESAR